MATIFRVGVCKFINNSGWNKLLSNTKDGKIARRGIAGRELRCTLPQVSKPSPWPYTKKKYTLLNYLFDKTTARFDQNSKLVVVEGPIAAGKTKFAQTLASELDMLYMPEANLDMLYTNEYGFNIKKLDSQIPEACRSFDVKDFLTNPRHTQVAKFQIHQYIVKLSQYIDALAHILSTGQGVVLDRCVYSDYVFLESMYKYGFVSKEARSIYYDIRKNTLNELMKPHLVLYLDVPIEKVLKNVKARNIPYEVKSPAITPGYIRTMEDNYKQKYLKDISTHAELLVYDWSEEGEVEVVVEDIERIDFDTHDLHDLKMQDWRYFKEEEWAVLRHRYADDKNDILMNLNVPRFDAPELVVGADDIRTYREVLESSPGGAYVYGYNASMGDSGLYYKTGINHRHTLPLIERQL